MLNRRFAAFAFFASFAPATAQAPPLPLPPTALAKAAEVVNLPRPENLEEIDPKTLSVKRVTGAWQLWANDKLFRTFGDAADDANDVARTIRELYPQRWGRIGTDRVVVEYGLTPDKDQNLVAPQVAGFARTFVAMDPKTLKVERVRGMWCLRDAGNLFLNFGLHRQDAEQALAVARKYGFNRIGTVGRKDAVMTFFTRQDEELALAVARASAFNRPGDPKPAPPPVSLPANVTFKMQADAMTRTGIPLPAVGPLGERKFVDPAKAEYAGEMTKIDPRKVEARTEGGEIVLASGREVLARFGMDDYTARDAVRVVRDARLTEFCKFGTAGVTFYLSNGQAPRNLPLHTLGPRFDPNGLRVQEANQKWYVATANNQLLFPAGSRPEAEALVKVVQAFGFDQLCTLGPGGKPAMVVLAKAR
jgi:hypothetical protein